MSAIRSGSAKAVLDAFEKPRMPAHAHLRVAELAHLSRLHRAAELGGHRLHAVADSEDRHSELEDRLGALKTAPQG